MRLDTDHDYEADLAAAETDPPEDPQNRNGSSEVIAAHIVNWRTLRGPTTPLEWVALRSFVEWFTVRYHVPISVVPNCWWRHGPLVEELSALHTAHTVSFDSRDTGYGPIQFHEQLAAAHARLTRAYGGGCSSGHQATKPRSWSDVTDEQEWETWAIQAHAHDTHPGVTNRKEEQ